MLNPNFERLFSNLEGYLHISMQWTKRSRMDIPGTSCLHLSKLRRDSVVETHPSSVELAWSFIRCE